VERVICHIEKSNDELLLKVQKVSPSLTPLSSTEHNWHFTYFTHHLQMANGNTVGKETENKTILCTTKSEYNRFSGANTTVVRLRQRKPAKKSYISIVHFLMYDKNASFKILSSFR
jgi:hypothetical protein